MDGKKIKKRFPEKTLLTFFFVISLLVTNKTVRAENNPKGITVSPSITRLDFSKDSTQTIITYTNTTDKTIDLELSAQDFTELEEGFRVKFLDEKNTENYKYGLSSWINFEKTTLTLQPNETKNIKIFIDENELSPGTHYASIIAKLKNNSTDEEVPIRGALASLLFVRPTEGKKIIEGSVNNFQIIQKYLSFPKQILIKFHNAGNVELVPYGRIEIKSKKGNLVAKGILNEGSLLTLPESIRKYETLLTPETNILFPGWYTATINVSLEQQQKTITQTKTFFTLGSKNFLIPAGTQLLAIAIILWKIKKRRKKNRKSGR